LGEIDSCLHRSGSHLGTKGEFFGFSQKFFNFPDRSEFRLPLDPVMLVISELLPKVQDLQTSLNKTNTAPAIIDFLASANISHALPRPPSIAPRQFVVSFGGLYRVELPS
jgi:hypothetical protein